MVIFRRREAIITGKTTCEWLETENYDIPGVLAAHLSVERKSLGNPFFV